MNRRNLLARGVSAALTLTLTLPMAPATAQQRPDMSRKAVTDDPIAPKRARPGYDVTIVEFFDYNCPYCRRMEPVLNTLLASDPKVRIVYRDWPIFGPPSREAARAAIASQWQNRHAAFHEALLTSPARLDSAGVKAAAARAKVDWPRLERDLKAHGAEIDALLARTNTIAEAIGFNGTPALIVGSQVVAGAVDLPSLRKLVASARAKPEAR
ncbi:MULTISPECIES: DsbA family protein [Sphingomonas]|uniref:DSBA oxidoreductase n=2 Tax=Sphingomonas TaxID=13687 RepID=A0A916WTD0_9SPHN|nr:MULTISPECIES: DsbA family protein [Sphingomonas]PAX08954.1 disulfide bond formation protein DsbA [Sphingomonas lenta]GGB30981.1 DSBA oxidoreductase [Sphingomonas metalli]